MKKIIIPMLSLVFFLSSCELINQAIPDVNTELTKTYLVTINELTPSGYTDTAEVDITSDDDYQEYADNITGYEIDKVTFEISDYDAPEGLYFAGSIEVAGGEGDMVYTLADIDASGLYDLSLQSDPTELNLDQSTVDQILAWLDDPGKFNVIMSYNFQDAAGNEYSFTQEDMGSSFKVVLHLHLVLLTGLAS